MPRLISTERGQGLNGRWLRLVGPSLPAITIEAADLPEDVLATNTKAVRRIHQVCCRLDDIATGRRQS